jgi:hypothetical protein
MSSTSTIPLTTAVARQMAVVAETATEEPTAPSRAERNAIRAVGERLLRGVDRERAAAVFGGGDPDAEFTALTVSSSTLRTYLKALDTLAAGTATPHRRQACRAVFDHLTDAVDVEALGLRETAFDRLDPFAGAPGVS